MFVASEICVASENPKSPSYVTQQRIVTTGLHACIFPLSGRFDCVFTKIRFYRTILSTPLPLVHSSDRFEQTPKDSQQQTIVINYSQNYSKRWTGELNFRPFASPVYTGVVEEIKGVGLQKYGAVLGRRLHDFTLRNTGLQQGVVHGDGDAILDAEAHIRRDFRLERQVAHLVVSHQVVVHPLTTRKCSR